MQTPWLCGMLIIAALLLGVAAGCGSPETTPAAPPSDAAPEAPSAPPTPAHAPEPAPEAVAPEPTVLVEDQEDPTVYVVGNYMVYHTEDCRYVKEPAGQVFSGKRSVVQEQQYRPCSECNPG